MTTRIAWPRSTYTTASSLPLFVCPRAEHPLLGGVVLELNHQRIVPEHLLGFFRGDPVPRDVLPVLGIPIEFHAYIVHTTCGDVEPAMAALDQIRLTPPTSDMRKQSSTGP